KAGDKVMGILYDADGENTTYELVDYPVASSDLVAKITATVTARSGNVYGTGTAAIGHPVAGEWTEIHASETVLNMSLSAIYVPYGMDIQIPVGKINGAWVLKTPLDLHQLKGFTAGQEQSVGKDADDIPEWQEDGDCDEEE